MVKPFLVVGIDFGTTYSGFSWAKSTGKRDIRLVNDWESRQDYDATKDKVPTCISFHSKGGPRHGYLASGKKQCKWFKLLLQPGNNADYEELKRASAILEAQGKPSTMQSPTIFAGFGLVGLRTLHNSLGKIS